MHAITLDAGDDVAAIIQAFRSELRDPTKPLSLLVRFEVEKAHGEKVEAAFGAAIPPTLNEPGCVVFNLNRDSRDPGRFVVYEQWRNPRRPRSASSEGLRLQASNRAEQTDRRRARVPGPAPRHARRKGFVIPHQGETVLIHVARRETRRRSAAQFHDAGQMRVARREERPQTCRVVACDGRCDGWTVR
jgi:hypothetical protein